MSQSESEFPVNEEHLNAPLVPRRGQGEWAGPHQQKWLRKQRCKFGVQLWKGRFNGKIMCLPFSKRGLNEMRDVLLRSSDFYVRARGKTGRERSGDTSMWETSDPPPVCFIMSYFVALMLMLFKFVTQNGCEIS